MRRTLVCTLFLLLGFASPVPADMDDALELVDQGNAALKAGRTEDAGTFFMQALEAEAGCVPARFGLGEALLAIDDVPAAVVAFRHVIRATTPGAPIPAAWMELRPQARKYLAEHDARGRVLEDLIEVHVDAVMRVALKYRTKDPDLTDRALQIVLSLRPEHRRAHEVRDALARKGARREAIFDGKQIADWDGGRGQWWKVEDGVIVGDTKGVATYIRNQKEIQGDYDVVMEARIVESYDDAPFIALMAAWKAEYDHSRFGTLTDALTWYEHLGEDRKERVFRCEMNRLKKPYDASEWTTYELRYRGDTTEAFVNGRKVHSIPRTKERSGGYVGILSQGCRAEIKRLDVLHR